MAAINDNGVLPPTPHKFVELVAQFSSATAALHEEPKDHERQVAYEAHRNVRASVIDERLREIMSRPAR